MASSGRLTTKDTPFFYFLTFCPVPTKLFGGPTRPDPFAIFRVAKIHESVTLRPINGSFREANCKKNAVLSDCKIGPLHISFKAFGPFRS